MGRNKIYFDDIGFHLLSSEMVVDLKVFGSFVKHGVIAKLDIALIVTVNVSRLVVQNSKFTQ